MFTILPLFKKKMLEITEEENKLNKIFKKVDSLDKIQKLFTDKEKLKKEVRKIRNKTQELCKEKNIKFSDFNLHEAIQNFDKLCLAAGCEHSFTGIQYN